MTLDLNTEKAWVTFLADGFETKWHAITDHEGKHMDWDSKEVMEHCRMWFGNAQFGIAPTSQMVMGNATRDNF